MDKRTQDVRIAFGLGVIAVVFVVSGIYKLFL